MNDLQINDIKALATIPDISIYIYMLLWILGVILIFVLIFLIYKIYTNRSKNIRKEYYSKLKELDLSQAKNSAYIITKYSRLLAQTPREKKLCDELIEELKSFKYKKEVDSLNDDVKILFGRFMDIVDV